MVALSGPITWPVPHEMRSFNRSIILALTPLQAINYKFIRLNHALLVNVILLYEESLYLIFFFTNQARRYTSNYILKQSSIEFMQGNMHFVINKLQAIFINIASYSHSVLKSSLQKDVTQLGQIPFNEWLMWILINSL